MLNNMEKFALQIGNLVLRLWMQITAVKKLKNIGKMNMPKSERIIPLFMHIGRQNYIK